MNHQGYTLLEVTLFLAISSLLTIVAFIGLGPRLRNIRFTAATRDLQSGLSRQFTDAAVGETGRVANFQCSSSTGAPVVSSKTGDTTATSGDCIINGRLAVFDTKQVTYYSIISLRNCETSGASNLFATIVDSCQPLVQTDSTLSPAPQTAMYDSGMTIKNTDTSANRFAFGYIQDPNSTARYSFVYTGPSVELSSRLFVSTAKGAINTLRDSAEHTICAKLSTRNAAFVFTTDQELPDLRYNQVGCTS